MPTLFSVPQAPTVPPNVAEELRWEGHLSIGPDDYLYSTSLRLMVSRFSGYYSGEVSLSNAGTIWNEHPTLESYFIAQVNLDWLDNSGLIMAKSVSGLTGAIQVESRLGGLVNTGSIYAICETNSATAIRHWSPGALIDNSGVIAASGRFAVGIAAHNGSMLINRVGAEILAEGGSYHGYPSAIAVTFERGSWQMPGFTVQGSDLVNYGRIEALSHDSTSSSIGINIVNLYLESMRIENHGVIRAEYAIQSDDTYFVPAQHASQQVVNSTSGLIHGEVKLSLGNDIIINSGQVVGQVLTEGDADYISNTGVIRGNVRLGDGNDLFIGESARSNGSVFGDGGNDLLVGSRGIDRLNGGHGDDVLFGADGDQLVGGAGADKFVIADQWTSGTLTITDFESGKDIIDLRRFAPTSVMLAGSTITAENANGTLVIEINAPVVSTDILSSSSSNIRGSATDDSLVSGVQGSTIFGYAGDDLLVGGHRDDRLEGGLGGDSMWGGAGDDIYVVDQTDYNAHNSVDFVIERPLEGYDVVESSVSYTLPSNVEKLILTGTNPIDGGGNELDNMLVGSAGTNWLNGGAGNDVLIGGYGDDAMDGEDGSDIYVIHSASERGQYEFIADDGKNGIDELRFSAVAAADTLVLTLADEGLERIVVGTGLGARADSTGTLAHQVDASALTYRVAVVGNAGANRLVATRHDDSVQGAAGDDRLYGLDGNDILDGGAGVDRLYGGLGNDTYYVSDTTDYAYENAGEGIDRVYASITHTLRVNVDYLYLTGTASVSGTGNDLANLLSGNSAGNTLRGLLGDDRLYGRDGADVLDGGAGNDLLEGGAGRDRMFGGTGADRFIFRDGDFASAVASGADQIHDFSQAEGDRIRLDLVDADTTLSGDQAFAFIGTTGFSGRAGELRFAQVSGNTYLSGDTNRDGFADFTLRLDGLQVLGTGDLVL